MKLIKLTLKEGNPVYVESNKVESILVVTYPTDAPTKIELPYGRSFYVRESIKEVLKAFSEEEPSSDFCPSCGKGIKRDSNAL